MKWNIFFMPERMVSHILTEYYWRIIIGRNCSNTLLRANNQQVKKDNRDSTRPVSLWFPHFNSVIFFTLFPMLSLLKKSLRCLLKSLMILEVVFLLEFISCVFLHRKQLCLLNGREEILELFNGKRKGRDGGGCVGEMWRKGNSDGSLIYWTYLKCLSFQERWEG